MATRTKKIVPTGRAIPVGEFIGINGCGINLEALRERFAEGGYKAAKTAHFLLLTRSEAPTTIIVHWFPLEQINDSIGQYFLEELHPLGVIHHLKDLNDVYSAIVGSLSPFDLQKAWQQYGINTLEIYRSLIRGPRELLVPSRPLHAFAALYKRVYELLVGSSYLDVGCAFGFLPMLIAEDIPSLQKIVAVDIQAEAFTYTPSIIEKRGLKYIHFIPKDVLSDDFGTLGTFDTVTALHVLEHFSESDMYRAVTHMLEVTTKKLIIAVPYEADEPMTIHGHKQVFTRAKLEALGQWCIEQLHGKGRMVYEDSADGLLIVERLP